MYFDANIRTDIRFLRNVVVRIDSLDKFLWIPVTVVKQTIRSIPYPYYVLCT